MATVYLDPVAGDDSRTYAQAQNSATPWKTLAKPIASATSGDTVEMAAGVYTWAQANVNKTLTWNAPALLNGLPQVAWDGGGLAFNWNVGYNWNSTLNRVELRNAKNNGHALFDVTYSGGVLNAVHTFNNCVMHDLYFDSSVDSVGLWAAGYTGDGTCALNGCVLYKLFRTNPAVYGSEAALVGSRSAHLNFTNVSIHFSGTGSNQLTKLFTGQGGTWHFNFRNVIVQNAGDAIYWIIHNGTILYDTFENCDVVGLNSPPASELAVDPVFIDPTNGDLHLSQTSPCRGTGGYA